MLCVALAAAIGPAGAAQKKVTERSKQKAAAEATRAEIAQKLARMKSELAKIEDQKEDAADTLAESEEAISNANRQLKELAQEQVETGQRLETLAEEQARLAAVVEAQRKQLADLMREQYIAGNEDRIKLLLSGDNPNRINRDMQLMAYVSRAKAQLLTSLRNNLAQVQTNQQKEQNAKAELDEIAQEERDQKALLEREKAKRAAVLGTLSKKAVTQRRQIGSLEKDQQRMTSLVDRLSRLIKQQAEAAAAEKRRQEAVAAARARAQAEAAALARARAQAEQERLAREAANPGAKPANPVEAEPPKVVQRPVEPAEPPARPADIALAPAAPDGAFASLKGKLRSPVAGQLAASFGSKRDGGPSWKGVFIKAPEGSEVRSIAAGRVVFASWMRGFGNLIIVDHGSEYLSIYGSNQSLLKRVGDAVKGGDPIASAGNTGGGEESGLYFELRHRGAAFNPASWISF
ncbi:peptidoglycan DD-metalloendopeptidase family protein [Massilia sp. PAMC28688]|uniref:murein hydrolase activator EnvC family protein n=1 Tax=Massilia sp. PAMC28688 TaxID=2861283 RepID=UPI001C63B6E5|nr:peptidoglycan DD-metalloendopeptidase family protein [Massilia sp. PAMC28688]QYF95966.1 peptidoglycan DD-metalloendopeptidase family protein [Massilia sp. PAMC28688]